MSQALNSELTKSQEKKILHQLDELFSKLDENNKAIRAEQKEITKLRKKNDKSFIRLSKAVDSLKAY